MPRAAAGARAGQGAEVPGAPGAGGAGAVGAGAAGGPGERARAGSARACACSAARARTCLTLGRCRVGSLCGVSTERKKRDDEDARRIALFRYRVLVPLLEEQAEAPLRERVAQSAARLHVHPLQGERRLSERTLWDWLQRFRSQGLDGLHPPQRCDKGQPRSVSPQVLTRAEALLYAATRIRGKMTGRSRGALTAGSRGKVTAGSRDKVTARSRGERAEAQRFVGWQGARSAEERRGTARRGATNAKKEKTGGRRLRSARRAGARRGRGCPARGSAARSGRPGPPRRQRLGTRHPSP